MNLRIDWKSAIWWLALAAMITVAVLSTVPGADRPHTGASGNLEHFVAYVGTAFLVALASRRLRGWRTVALLSGAAAVFEILQIWIPGRGAGVDNWAASSFGAVVGTIVAVWLARRLAVDEVAPVEASGDEPV